MENYTFPFLFVKMNVQYIKNKATQKVMNNTDYKSAFNDNCLLIFVAVKVAWLLVKGQKN